MPNRTARLGESDEFQGRNWEEVVTIEVQVEDGVGFEPTERSSRSEVFKTSAFNRSATHPSAPGFGPRAPAPFASYPRGAFAVLIHS